MTTQNATTKTVMSASLFNIDRRNSLRRRTPSVKFANFLGSLYDKKRKTSSSHPKSGHFEPLSSQGIIAEKSNRPNYSTDETIYMPRNLKPELISLAVEAVTQKWLTIGKASQVFKISKSILSNRISRNKSNAVKGQHEKRQQQFDVGNLEKLCKVTTVKTDDEILYALKGGNVGIKEACNLIRILSAYIKKIETVDTGQGKYKKRVWQKPVKLVKTNEMQQVEVDVETVDGVIQNIITDTGEHVEEVEKKVEEIIEEKIIEIDTEEEIEEEEEEIEEEVGNDEVEEIEEEVKIKEEEEEIEEDYFDSEEEMETDARNNNGKLHQLVQVNKKGTLLSKKKKQWSLFDMKQAVEAVKEDNKSLGFAAKKYGVPKSTLYHAVSEKKINKISGKQYLTDEEEQQLAGWLVMMHKIGWEVSKQDVMDTVKILADKEGRKLRDNKDNKPRRDWWYGFLRRHKEVADIRQAGKGKFANTDKAIENDGLEVIDHTDESCQNISHEDIYVNEMESVVTENINRNDMLQNSNEDISENETSPVNTDNENDTLPISTENENETPISTENLNENETPINTENINENESTISNNSEINIITIESPCKTSTIPLFKRDAPCIISGEDGNDDSANHDLTDVSNSKRRKSLFKEYLNSLNDSTGDTTENKCTDKAHRNVKQKRKLKNWSVFDMQRAVAAVKEDQLSLGFASKKYGIPKSTLHGAVTGKTIIGKKSGKKFLTDEDEKSLAGWLVMMHNVGKEISKREVVEIVKDMLDKQGRTIPTKDNRPGKDWWGGFLGRHQEVAKLRTPKGRYGQTFLTERDELTLTEWIVTMRKAGNEVSMKNVIETAKDILDKQGKKIPKKDNRPGRDWWNGFLSRHDEISDLRYTKKVKSEETNKPGDIGGTTDKKSTPQGKTNVKKRKNLEQEINKCLKKVQAAKRKYSTSSITSATSKKQRFENSDSEEDDDSEEEKDNDSEEDNDNEEEKDNDSEEDKESGSEEDDGVCVACGGNYNTSDSSETWVCCGVTDEDGKQTDGCGGWFHLTCTDLSDCNLTKKELKVMTWHCQACTAVACVQNVVSV